MVLCQLWAALEQLFSHFGKMLSNRPCMWGEIGKLRLYTSYIYPGRHRLFKQKPLGIGFSYQPTTFSYMSKPDADGLRAEKTMVR